MKEFYKTHIEKYIERVKHFIDVFRTDKRRRNRTLLFALYLVMILFFLSVGFYNLFLSPVETRTLYYYNKRSKKVSKEKQEILKAKSKANKIRNVVRALRDGPNDINLNRLIPYETRIRNVLLVDDMLIIDFNEEFFIGVESGKEKYVIESLSKSIFKNFGYVNYIKILINNQTVGYYGENINLKTPIVRPSHQKKLIKQRKKELRLMEKTN